MVTVVTPMPVPAPSRSMSQEVFDAAVAARIVAEPIYTAQFNTAVGEVNTANLAAAASATQAAGQAALATSAAATATSTIGALQWVSGATYAAVTGVAISLINFLTYRRKITGAGTIDPANDATNWAPVNSASAPIIAVTASKTMTAGDRSSIQSCNSASAILLSYPTAASVGNGWNQWIENLGSATVTAAGFSLRQNSLNWIVSDGTNFRVFPMPSTTYGKIGATIASSATLNLDSATGDTVHISGTTTITAITLSPGVVRTCIFDSVLTIVNSATLILPFNASVITPSTTGDAFVFVGESGGVVRCISMPAWSRQYLNIRDEKATGVAAGASIVGTQIRTINVVVSNTMPGASLSGNNFTLPAGSYQISAKSPAVACDNNRISLFNNTDGVTTILGSSDYATFNTTITSFSYVVGAFTITAPKSFCIKHYTATVTTPHGLGRPASDGAVEIYTNVEIWKEL